MSLYPIFKSIVFKLDPEVAHHLTMELMRKFSFLYPTHKIDPRLSFKRNGLVFPSPFGLAAGLDKNAEVVSFLTKLPFGFIEVGTVTPKSQGGNERPRLFRYPEIESLRNRMGFNNHGLVTMDRNIKRSLKHQRLLGVNVGKNKITSNEDAHLDYEKLLVHFDKMTEVDFLVINVSSPNTPGLRSLLQDTALSKLFETLETHQWLKPIYLKISPDMSESELKSVIEILKNSKIKGLIATNTTIMTRFGEGGMSGKILFEKARKVRNFLLQELKGNADIHLIGVGGFSSFSEIKEYWINGGDVVELYSSFIFQGPELLYELENDLLEDMINVKAPDFEHYLKAIRS